MRSGIRSALRLTLCLAAALSAPALADAGSAEASGDEQVTAAPRDVTAGESTRAMGAAGAEPGFTRTSLDASPARDAASAADSPREEERITEIWTAE